MSSERSRIIQLIEQEHIPERKVHEALTILKFRPDSRSWFKFIDNLLLWIGSLSVVFSILFIVAYNWTGMGRFGKFALVELFMALCIIGFCWLDDKNIAGKTLLLVSTLTLGVLLALFGQTYQTGADPWQLFFYWGVLMLPWALVGRFPAIWIVWVMLINISIVLYFSSFLGIFWLTTDITSAQWLLFAFNTFVLFAWQMLVPIWSWLSERWAIRFLAIASGTPLTWLVILSLFDYREVGIFPGFVWFGWLIVMYCVYRKWVVDVFILAGICFSVIAVVTSNLFKLFLKSFDVGVLLATAFLIIGMGAISAFWLKNIYQESQQ